MADKADDASKASTTSTSTDAVVHRGGCHCGAVAFEFTAPRVLRAVECNCSICRLKGNPYVIVPQSNFRLSTGEGSLTEYRFNTKRARHLFCKVCGVQSFYYPRSNPDSVSVLVPAVDRATIEGVETSSFDGVNWEKSFAEGAPSACK